MLLELILCRTRIKYYNVIGIALQSVVNNVNQPIQNLHRLQGLSYFQGSENKRIVFCSDNCDGYSKEKFVHVRFLFD